jgi:hypothetical protein
MPGRRLSGEKERAFLGARSEGASMPVACARAGISLSSGTRILRRQRAQRGPAAEFNDAVRVMVERALREQAEALLRRDIQAQVQPLREQVQALREEVREVRRREDVQSLREALEALEARIASTRSPYTRRGI